MNVIELRTDPGASAERGHSTWSVLDQTVQFVILIEGSLTQPIGI